MRTLTFVLAATLLAAGTVQADISVDGSLLDWGVTPGSDYVPNSGINSWIEPEIGSGGYVEPGWGGQTFNVEAMYSTIVNGNFCFAVITGFPPEGVNGYYPGDIFIDFEPHYVPTDNPTVPNGTIDFAIETTTYGTGYEHGGIGAEGAGALFADVTPGLANLKWDGVYYPYEIARDASHAALGTLLTTPTEFIYSYWGSDHYVIEGCVDADVFFGSGTVGGLNGLISWTMGCANDRGFVYQTFEDHEIVPEPVSLALFLGSVGVGLLRKRLAPGLSHLRAES